MTHIKSIILACAALLALASCDNNYPIPPYVEPQFTLAAGERVISIDTLKSLHTLGSTPRYIGEDFVVNGVVVGDDESGNIYKSIYLQDATGGINLAIDNVNMYNTMPVGQQVYVRLKGLFVGDYNNGYQLGDTVTDSQYGLEMARYDWANEYVDSTATSSRLENQTRLMFLLRVLLLLPTKLLPTCTALLLRWIMCQYPKRQVVLW